MKIHIKIDDDGEWVEFYVDGKLIEEGHHVRSHWYEDILREKFGVEITKEYCSLEE